MSYLLRHTQRNRTKKNKNLLKIILLTQINENILALLIKSEKILQKSKKYNKYLQLIKSLKNIEQQPSPLKIRQ